MGKALDLTNQRFGRLVALYKTDKRDNNGCIYWYCKCDCGNEIDVIASSLRRKNTQSCGCFFKDSVTQNGKNKIIDLTNQRFGKLIALYPTEKRQCESVIWHCKCDCGNECDVNGSYLRDGKTSSCGCIMSKGELKISQILNENNIKFEQQKTFNSCRFKDTNALAKFDFYLSDYNILIEYDGIQHFQYKTNGWNNKENFIKTQEHDNFKNQWCKENNIPLIRIPYTEIEDITLDTLLKKGAQQYDQY